MNKRYLGVLLFFVLVLSCSGVFESSEVEPDIKLNESVHGAWMFFSPKSNLDSILTIVSDNDTISFNFINPHSRRNIE